MVGCVSKVEFQFWVGMWVDLFKQTSRVTSDNHMPCSQKTGERRGFKMQIHAGCYQQAMGVQLAECTV